MEKSMMEMEDDRIYNSLLQQGIPESILRKPNRRVVRFGNMEFDMNAMTDKDLDGYIDAFSSSIDGIKRALHHMNYEQHIDDEDVEKLFWQMDDAQNQMQMVVDGFKIEKENRKRHQGESNS